MTQTKSLGALLAAVVAGGVLLGIAGPAEPQQAAPATVLVTDVGQGNTAKITRMLLKKNGYDALELIELATPEDLEGVTLLIVGVGASTKGLGAAGLDLDQEMERASRLLAAARERSITIVGVHLGGQARRGELSDALNKLVMQASDTFVVWQEGDEDGFFSKLARERLGDGADEQALHRLLRVVESKKDVGSELKGILESP